VLRERELQDSKTQKKSVWTHSDLVCSSGWTDFKTNYNCAGEQTGVADKKKSDTTFAECQKTCAEYTYMAFWTGGEFKGSCRCYFDCASGVSTHESNPNTVCTKASASAKPGAPVTAASGGKEESNGSAAANESLKLVLDQFAEEDEDCSGMPMATYIFNQTGPPNFAEPDKCMEIKNQTGTNKGHVKFFCSGAEIHLDEFLKDPADDKCDKNEPRSLVIRGDDMLKVPTGECVAAYDQNETKVHIKFRDIDEAIKWPNCNVSGGGNLLIIIIVGVGVFIVLVIAIFIVCRQQNGGEYGVTKLQQQKGSQGKGQSSWGKGQLQGGEDSWGEGQSQWDQEPWGTGPSQEEIGSGKGW